MYNKILEHLKNKKIAIVGFGREGKSTYKFIRKYLNNQELEILDGNEKLLELNGRYREMWDVYTEAKEIEVIKYPNDIFPSITRIQPIPANNNKLTSSRSSFKKVSKVLRF